MTEREVSACETAANNYGLALEDPRGTREMKPGRMDQDERDLFRAGWEAARKFYLPETE